MEIINNQDTCPLCDGKVEDKFRVGRSLDHEYICHTCGSFAMTWQLHSCISYYIEKDPLFRNRLKRCIWDHRLTGKVMFARDPVDPDDDYVNIDAETAMRLYNSEGSPLDKLNHTLVNLSNSTSLLGQKLDQKYRWDIITLDDNEAKSLLEALIHKGYVRGEVESGISFNVEITASGLECAQRTNGAAYETTDADARNAALQTQTSESTGLVPEISTADYDSISSTNAKVFISHAHQDVAFVKQLSSDLAAHGILHWLDSKDLKYGHSIPSQIQGGIYSSQYLVVVLSPDALVSKWVKAEWEAAYTREMGVGGITVLPIHLVDCEIPVLLNNKKWFDFRDPHQYTAEVIELVKTIRGS